VLGLGVEGTTVAGVTVAIDRAMLAKLALIVDETTGALDSYQYHRALERTEAFFWEFCNDYVELVKDRAYREGEPSRSAQAALSIALSTLTRLFAPFLPFVTEETWCWWQPGSVHQAPWPTSAELLAVSDTADPSVLDVAASVLADVRRAKAAEQRSLRSGVLRLVVEDATAQLRALKLAEADLRQAGVVAELVLRESPIRSVRIELDPAAT
jgi:valyl-tRNA synthetase